MTSTCRHCGKRIVSVNWATGADWTHQPAGASFQDDMHRYCHRTVAEPIETTLAGGCSECRQIDGHHKLDCGRRS